MAPGHHPYMHMGWSVGFDAHWNRCVGYGVTAYCDAPGCRAEIDRGLAYVCGGYLYGGEHGCGLFFCDEHRRGYRAGAGEAVCRRCAAYRPPYKRVSIEHPAWLAHLLGDPSWAGWRAEHPESVEFIQQAVSCQPGAVAVLRAQYPRGLHGLGPVKQSL